MLPEQRVIIDKYATEKAFSSYEWFKEKGAIYDPDIQEWIPLNDDMLNVMRIALMTVAEELTLNMPNLNGEHSCSKLSRY